MHNTPQEGEEEEGQETMWGSCLAVLRVIRLLPVAQCVHVKGLEALLSPVYLSWATVVLLQPRQPGYDDIV